MTKTDVRQEVYDVLLITTLPHLGNVVMKLI